MLEPIIILSLFFLVATLLHFILLRGFRNDSNPSKFQAIPNLLLICSYILSLITIWSSFDYSDEWSLYRREKFLLKKAVYNWMDNNTLYPNNYQVTHISEPTCYGLGLISDREPVILRMAGKKIPKELADGFYRLIVKCKLARPNEKGKATIVSFTILPDYSVCKVCTDSEIFNYYFRK